MKTLFDVLDGIVESDYTLENLASAEAVINCASAAGLEVNEDQANSIIRVGKHWLEQRENGGEWSRMREEARIAWSRLMPGTKWSRMREEAKAGLTCYMQIDCGDVATAEMWKNDFDAMDVESWFGKPAEECADLHWLSDNNSLVEVEFDTDLQEWIDFV